MDIWGSGRVHGSSRRSSSSFSQRQSLPEVGPGGCLQGGFLDGHRQPRRGGGGGERGGDASSASPLLSAPAPTRDRPLPRGFLVVNEVSSLQIFSQSTGQINCLF